MTSYLAEIHHVLEIKELWNELWTLKSNQITVDFYGFSRFFRLIIWYKTAQPYARIKISPRLAIIPWNRWNLNEFWTWKGWNRTWNSPQGRTKFLFNPFLRNNLHPVQSWKFVKPFRLKNSQKSRIDFVLNWLINHKTNHSEPRFDGNIAVTMTHYGVGLLSSLPNRPFKHARQTCQQHRCNSCIATYLQCISWSCSPFKNGPNWWLCFECNNSGDPPI